ncbi:crotonase/enoyl-CoA hydratase family protein [Shewanella gelidii]|uniref:Enoyl-CoA hydratase n=1 Tax=Shewanella gelidii TaxID=1642821 RepID=A0A917JQE0_9GAMM|nr:crotonase/enoyl-CoA hydratase family protein [Shewanella gelidii]MCL1097819.1 crotonase/enoyl-CoA hydratase family protein [Shewanella gelidii]GGI78514.1 enoyl-CoA hydratase [Shewanella gelidii]
MDWKSLTLDIKDQIAYVQLNRPEKFNAIDYTMFKELDVVIKHLKKNKQVRAVILSGSNGNFSSGLDVKSVASSPSKAFKLLVKILPGNANLAQRVSLGWQQLPVPVIAVIEGHCFGGGTQIALGADFRIAAPDARLSIMEAKWGLLPDMAGLVALRQIVGKDRALELTMSARIIGAEEAQTIGLITQVSSEPYAEAKALIQRLTVTSPDAIAAIKLSINQSWTGSVRSLLARETLSQIKLLIGKNRVIASLRQTKQPDKSYIDRQTWS